jgi:hypothetical protein
LESALGRTISPASRYATTTARRAILKPTAGSTKMPPIIAPMLRVTAE